MDWDANKCINYLQSHVFYGLVGRNGEMFVYLLYFRKLKNCDSLLVEYRLQVLSDSTPLRESPDFRDYIHSFLSIWYVFRSYGSIIKVLIIVSKTSARPTILKAHSLILCEFKKSIKDKKDLDKYLKRNYLF